MGERTRKALRTLRPTPLTPEQQRYNKLRGQAQNFADDIKRYLEQGRADLVPKVTRLINQICREMEQLRKIIKP